VQRPALSCEITWESLEVWIRPWEMEEYNEEQSVGSAEWQNSSCFESKLLLFSITSETMFCILCNSCKRFFYFSRMEIIRFWMAEGFLVMWGNNVMEEPGCEVLEDLLCWSFSQVPPSKYVSQVKATSDREMSKSRIPFCTRGTSQKLHIYQFHENLWVSKSGRTFITPLPKFEISALLPPFPCKT